MATANEPWLRHHHLRVGKISINDDRLSPDRNAIVDSRGTDAVAAHPRHIFLSLILIGARLPVQKAALLHWTSAGHTAGTAVLHVAISGASLCGMGEGRR